MSPIPYSTEYDSSDFSGSRGKILWWALFLLVMVSGNACEGQQILLADRFDSASYSAAGFNSTLAADQSGILAPVTYTLAGHSADHKIQHGNGGQMLLAAWHDSQSLDLYASLNHNFASESNTSDLPLKIEFDLKVLAASDPTNWAAVAIGSAQNAFVPVSSNKFSCLFRQSEGTQPFASGNALGGGFVWNPQASSISILLSDTSGARSPFKGNGSLARIYINGTLAATYPLSQMTAADGYVSLESLGAFAYYDNLSVSLTDGNEPTATFHHFPRNFQLYPRDLSTNQGKVLMEGVVTGADCTAVSVSVTRNGSPYASRSQPLVYSAGVAPFSMDTSIPAEQADYQFKFYVTKNGKDYLLGSASNVVAGDFYLINGQSNAEARMFADSANGNRSTYIRSFGTRDDSGANVLADQNWYQADGDLLYGSGAVGQWGLRLARRILDTYHLPVAIINGARGGWPITSFQRNDGKPEDLGTNYGRALYRVTQAGGRNHVRAIFWYQGESDNGDADAHEKGWISLRDDWHKDFPSIEKIYLFQLHVGCLTGQFDVDLRNRQRLLADRFPEVEVMSTTGVGNTFDNCHYPFVNGYQKLADQLFPLVQRDLYGAPPENDIEPPNPYYAYFSAPGNRQLTVIMRNPNDTLMFYPGAEADFKLLGTSVVVTGASTSGNRLILNLSGDAGGATGLIYGGHIGAAEPMVTNGTGVGLLAFHDLPIHADLSVPGVPSKVTCLPVSGKRVDISWSAGTRAAEYLIRRDGEVIGKTTGTVFIDSTVVAGNQYVYQVSARNPVGASAWSSAVAASVVPDNVYAFVPEAAHFTMLYRMDIPNDLRLGSTLKAPYQSDSSSQMVQPFDRIAYYLELQTDPGQPLKWVYVSCDPFSQDPARLGIPSLATGTVIHQPIHHVNVYASSGSGITTGEGLGSGNVEFWGSNYQTTNGYGVPGASDATYDSGDLMVNSGSYGSMQIFRAGQTLFGYNGWGESTADGGAQSSDDLGIGTPATGHPDWTFAANSFRYSHKRLCVLVRTDYSNWSGSNHLKGGPTEDDDLDGLSNFMEYAFGLDPKSGGAVRPSLDFQVPPTGVLSYTRRKASLTGLSYTVLTSTDLAEWTADKGAVQTVTGGEGDLETVQVTLSPPLLSHSKWFVRISTP